MGILVYVSLLERAAGLVPDLGLDPLVSDPRFAEQVAAIDAAVAAGVRALGDSSRRCFPCAAQAPKTNLVPVELSGTRPGSSCLAIS